MSSDSLTILNQLKSSGQNEINEAIEDFKTNIFKSIVHRRTDILISILNESFKNLEDCELYSKASVKWAILNENFCNENTRTPLHAAFYQSDSDILRVLLQFGADPGIKEKTTNKSVFELINQSNNQNLKSIIINSFLQFLALNDLFKIKQFIVAGMDINSTEGIGEGNSFLHWAVLYSDENTVKFLLDNGANVNALNENGASPLHECLLKRKDKKVIDILLDFDADLTIKATKGLYKDKTPVDLCSGDLNMHEFVTNHKNISKQVDSSPSKSVLKETDSVSIPTTPIKKESITHNHMLNFHPNWCDYEILDDTERKFENSLSLLWPKPKVLILNEKDDKRFEIADVSKEIDIYVKGSNSLTLYKVLQKVVAFQNERKFNFVRKSGNGPYLSIEINPERFQVDNSYSIIVKQKTVEICAKDKIGALYGFVTFLQLCKIFAKSNIPALKLVDDPDVKYRSILIDFSQGFFFKFDYLYSLVYFLFKLKINQVHFFVKFSNYLKDNKQWYHFIGNDWLKLIDFCEDLGITIVPAIDIHNDVAEVDDVSAEIEEYLELFKNFNFVNVGPRLSSLLICMENKNPFKLDSNQSMMISSFLYHNSDDEIKLEFEKFENAILLEYGLKVGHDFKEKSKNLNDSGKPFFYCVGSCNWNSLLGCPEAYLLNINEAISSINNAPVGLLLCNYSGALIKTPFAFNLTSIFAFAGLTWNCQVGLNEIKTNLPVLIKKHGLLTNHDGLIGVLLMQLGSIETFLTQKIENMQSFEGLPLDKGSLLYRLLVTPDDIDMENVDIDSIKKLFAQFKKILTKLRSVSTEGLNTMFKELTAYVELTLYLIKFLVAIYSAGSKQQTNTIGLRAINIGVANLPETIKTDLANKIIVIKEELYAAWSLYCYEESLKHQTKNYENLIEKLLNISLKDYSIGDGYVVLNTNSAKRTLSQSVYLKDNIQII